MHSLHLRLVLLPRGRPADADMATHTESHTAQTKTPLRGFFGRESLSEARAHRLESRGDFAVQASKVAHQTAGLEDHVSFPLPEMRVASTLRGAV